jgi:hypothetical protein
VRDQVAAGTVREAEVDYRNVYRLALEQLSRFRERPRLSYNVEAWLVSQRPGHSLTNGSVIVHEEDPCLLPARCRPGITGGAGFFISRHLHGNPRADVGLAIDCQVSS